MPTPRRIRANATTGVATTTHPVPGGHKGRPYGYNATGISCPAGTFHMAQPYCTATGDFTCCAPARTYGSIFEAFSYRSSSEKTQPQYFCI